MAQRYIRKRVRAHYCSLPRLLPGARPLAAIVQPRQPDRLLSPLRSGDGDRPIINLSVGASCVFGVRDGRARRTIRLDSGDALIFGGPARFIEHAVLSVSLSERPGWMSDACRFSFTFRDASSVTGREDFFRTFDVSRTWFEQTQRTWKLGDPLVEAEVA